MTFGMRRWAQFQQRTGTPTYLYFMDHVPPAFHLYWTDNPHLQLPDGPRSGGAYHSGDLALVFGNTRRVGVDWQDADHVVSDLMLGYWTSFAATGDPNGGGRPVWPPFDPETFATQLLNATPQSVEGVRRTQLDIMEAIYPLPESHDN